MIKKIILIVSLVVLVLVLIGASIFSILKFKTYNPISSCFGMIQILFTEKEYVVIQNNPNKVVLLKPEYTSKYLSDEGWKEIEERRMGSIGVYENDDEIANIYTRINGYYSVLVWENVEKK